ncbi:hypothetical protein BDN72DRAFT_844398 [Pluteus cervinus]|uniref:Uncharacterized protein n=1 Tax=Pluteus cervinus TaxID=181527 RepID=A0ACD3AL77_9AGAR|nr:hypothetical protein BDN72DRAFT_844398 [Pluteus cervinus]
MTKKAVNWTRRACGRLPVPVGLVISAGTLLFYFLMFNLWGKEVTSPQSPRSGNAQFLDLIYSYPVFAGIHYPDPT